jgi:RNA polymerase sigma-70 factor, ECF subfamily
LKRHSAKLAKPPGEAARERLLVEAAQNDPRRFVDLYEENFERVYAYVARRIRERADAEDVTAGVFHQALANLKDFEWRGAPFAAWLYRIAANSIADRWRQKARESGNPAPEDPPDTRRDANPEEIEKRARLFRLVAELPADQRAVVEMRFAEGKSIREIAKEIRRSEGAVKQLQFRGVQTLRMLWDKKAAGKHGKK